MIMIAFLTDEDFNGRIVRGLFLRNPKLDLIRVQDIGLSGASDQVILQWAADHRRILLTHDRRSVPHHVSTRLKSGNHIPGVFIVDDLVPVGICLSDLLLIAECSDSEEWFDRIVYLPFQR